MKLIPHNGKPFGEVRKAHFLRAFDRPVELMQIVSFGSCNFHCPYCKRDGQYIDSNGNIYTAKEYDFNIVLEGLLQVDNRIRLSGGDPCMHVKESLAIARAVMDVKGQKISIANNGSSLSFVKLIAPYLEYAAIDIKASSGAEFATRAGLGSQLIGRKMLENSLKVQSYLTQECKILVDVRTCVFADTTLDDLLTIARLIVSNNDTSRVFWTVRGYNPVEGVDWRKPNHESLLNNLGIVAETFPKLKIGYRDKWVDAKFHYFNM